MIINLLNKEINNKNTQEPANAQKDISISSIKKYLVKEKLEIFKSNNKALLEDEVKKYLYEKFNLSDHYKITEIIKKLTDQMFGYDILQKYIDDSSISDIRAVSFDHIYIKRKGKWFKIEEYFDSEEEFLEYVRFIVLKNGGKINYDTPIITISDKKYNLRIEAGISPVNTLSPNIVIRIHRNNLNINLDVLYREHEMFNLKILKFLKDIINNRSNIVISGKGGSGKTTLMKCLILQLPEELAITCNEETAELYLNSRNIIQREILEGREKNTINLEMLMKQALVMSNDVIIVGELKGSETMMFFDSIGTGHMGIATVHSNNATNTVNRLVTLIKRDVKAQQYTEKFIKNLIASSVDYIIHMKDYKINEIIKLSLNFETDTMEYKKVYDINATKKKKSLKKDEVRVNGI